VNLTTEQRRELELLIVAGRKIEAIKEFRIISNVGLAEAKAFIDSLERGAHEPGAHEGSPRRDKWAQEDALAALRAGDYIDAIRRYRVKTGVGLKEAKAAVEALSVTHQTEGRINPKLAADLISMVALGQRDAATTHLMSQVGYDENEARAALKIISGVRFGGASGGGCVRVIIGVIILTTIAVVLLNS